MHIIGTEWYMDVYCPILFNTMGTLEKTEFLRYHKTVEYLNNMLHMFAKMLQFSKYTPHQYPMKYANAMREAISPSDLDSCIKNSDNSFREVCKKHKKGWLIDEEKEGEFNRIFYEGFYKLLEEHGLYTGFNDKSWVKFNDEYILYKEGKQPDSSLSDYWLRYDDSVEASALDKASFFKLIDAYFIPIEYFTPVPEDYVKPLHHFTMYGNGMSGAIEFYLVDDGGLFSDSNPSGKIFTLIDDKGLKAELNIIRLATKEDNNNNRFVAKYIGEGTIEGYTSMRKREISISEIDKNNMTYLYLHIENDDLDTFYEFPLWQDYHKFIFERSKIAKKHIHALMDYYDKSIE